LLHSDPIDSVWIDSGTTHPRQKLPPFGKKGKANQAGGVVISMLQATPSPQRAAEKPYKIVIRSILRDSLYAFSTWAKLNFCIIFGGATNQAIRFASGVSRAESQAINRRHLQ
jgi:hypothetical protein